MNKDLVSLVKLQNIDGRIYELMQSKKEFPAEAEKLAAEIQKAQDVVSSIEKKIEETEAERRAVKDQIDNAKQALGKSEERLSSITTNREYDAVHSEIETHRHTIANGDSRLKNFDQDTERLTSQKEEAQKEADTIRGENQPKIDDFTARIASIDSDIAEVVKERNAIVPTIGRQFFRTYEHIHKRRKNGRAISLVSMGEGTCAICHKILEAQLLNELRKGQRLQICESCGSLLIWNATEIQQEAAEALKEEPAKEEKPSGEKSKEEKSEEAASEG